MRQFVSGFADDPDQESHFKEVFGLSMDDCFFVDTTVEKLSKISECGCDYFIDDLVEVLVNPDFPRGVKKVLFSSDPGCDLPQNIINSGSWDVIQEFIFGK